MFNMGPGEPRRLYVSYGNNTVHLAAPGSIIRSTMYLGNPASPGYDNKTGTSMAAPHVTGAVALVWAKHPTWTYQQVRNLLLSTVHKVSGLAPLTITDGRLDIGAALLDCNNNGVADGVDMNTFASLDCDNNRVPDECDGVGGCCIPESGGACCVTEAECEELYGNWSPLTNCLVCPY